MTSGICLVVIVVDGAVFASLLLVAAGVRGGECTPTLTGDRIGEASLDPAREPWPEPAGIVLLGGAPLADCTYDISVRSCYKPVLSWNLLVIQQ